FDAQVLFARRRDHGRSHSARPGQTGGPLHCGSDQLHRLARALWPALGRRRAPPVSSLRALLLSGDRIRDRASPAPGRSRCAGRAQDRAGLRPGHDLFGPPHRRSGLAPRHRRLSQARARLRRGRRPRACGSRAVPEGSTGRRRLNRPSLTRPRSLARERSAATVEEIFMPSYDDTNIFAKILRGEMPAYKVYEDEKSLAFLDIMPRAPGHTLVLPKNKARNILDVAPDDLCHVMKVTQKIARA